MLVVYVYFYLLVDSTSKNYSINDLFDTDIPFVSPRESFHYVLITDLIKTKTLLFHNV